MKRFKPYQLFAVAWILFSIVQTTRCVVNVQSDVFCFLNGFTCGLMIVGAAMCAPVSKETFGKIRAWKIRLIGR